MASLFKAIKRRGIKYHCHESDLYLPDNPRVRRVLKNFPVQAKHATRFRNQVEGGTWIDVPFACEVRSRR